MKILGDETAALIESSKFVGGIDRPADSLIGRRSMYPWKIRELISRVEIEGTRLRGGHRSAANGIRGLN